MNAVFPSITIDRWIRIAIFAAEKPNFVVQTSVTMCLVKIVAYKPLIRVADL